MTEVLEKRQGTNTATDGTRTEDIYAQLRHQIQAGLNTLSPHERLIFELRHYQGVSLPSIGEIMQIDDVQIKMLFRQAVSKLRALVCRE